MKLTIDGKSFVDAVSWVTKSFDNKNDQAFIELFIKKNGTGTLSYSNSSSYMTSNLLIEGLDYADDEDQKDLEYALDGKYLQRLAGALGSGNGSIVLSQKLNSAKASLDAKTNSGKFTIPILYSAVSKTPKVFNIGEVDDNEFFDSMTRIARLCDASTFGSSSALGAVDLGFNSKDKTISILGTDRYALGETVLEFDPTEYDEDEIPEAVQQIADSHILIPYSSAVLVSPSKGVDTSITLIIEDGENLGATRFGYSFPDGRMALFSLLSANSISGVSKMKEKAEKTVEYNVTVAKADLLKAIKVVSSLAWDEDNIFFNISKNGLVVSDSSDKNLQEVVVSESDYDEDEEYRVCFSRPVINEAFSPISTTNMRFKWGPKSVSFLLEPVTDDGETVSNIFVMAVISQSN